MSDLLSTLGLLLLALTVPGSLYLFTLTWAAMLPVRVSQGSVLLGRLAIVVPAHNEAGGIARTLANLLTAAAEDGSTEVVVIADNCCDATADIARACGARVLERHDPALRGKGHALDHAFGILMNERFAAFVVIDADSQVGPGFIGYLRRHFGAGAQALQARYTVLNGDDSPRTRLAALALAAFNVLRPRGRDRLRLSAGILGNGFALRRDVLQCVPYTAASVVEDLEYHLQLIEAGIRVEFVDAAVVRGEMPINPQGQDSQRARWEGGRLRMLRERGPGLAAGILRGHWRLLEPLADLMLLPLAYHAMLLLLVSALLAVADPGPALSLALGSLGLLALHVLAAVRIGSLPWSHLLLLARLPGYLLWKLRMVQPILASSRRDSAWVRTQRNGS